MFVVRKKDNLDKVTRYGGLTVPDILAFPFRAVPFTTDPFPLGNDVRVIAPFWTNIGPGGSIVFAAIDDTTLLQKANSYVNDAYPCQADFSATVILIATYTKVVAAGGTQTNTFQVVLATDGDRTYAIFQYADNGIGWSESGGEHAQVGISVDNIKETHPDSGTANIIRVATGSNVNVAGRYIYRIDVGPSSSTEMREYYLGFFNTIGDAEPSITIATQESGPTPYSIDAPGVGYSASGMVSRNNEVVLNLPNNLVAASSGIGDLGIHLRVGSDKVTVTGQAVAPSTVGTFLGLPAIMSDSYVYYAVSIPFTTRSPYVSYILIVGIENDTTITYSGGTRMINGLQTLLISDPNDLTGTKIVASKQVSVFSGHQCALFPVGVGFCDQIVEQIPPTTKWGRVYYTAPLTTRMSYTIKVVAANDSTNVDIYCNDVKESHTLNEAGSVTKTASSSEYCAISSDKPILVAQLAHGFQDDGTSGDPMMTLVPATNQFDSKFQFSTIQGVTGYLHYANIIVLADDFQADMINMAGCGVNNPLNTQTWVAIKVNSNPEAYATQLVITEGVNEITHDDSNAKMTVIVYGFAASEGYGHPGGISDS
ncbi:IgGFc-binding protein-like isoform X2 [Dysidea avara]|uniref:IgGFc-binding protein-like isoform X2 n=1 Tax=Dysidea avara TaxID=196820 RepID=UPI00332AABFF